MKEECRRPESCFWQGRRVLVTGATGIVGSWLVKELLALGASVVGLVRDADPQSELYRSGDIYQISVVTGCLEDFWTLEQAISKHEVETVFHLGAQTIVGTAYRSPLPTMEANIRGTYNMLEACRLHSNLVQQIVIASSDKAYGAQPILPYTEDQSLIGRHPYDVSKSCTDLIAQSYHHTYRLPVAITRCGNVYGGGDLNWSRIVPGTIGSLVRGEAPVIRSDGSFVRDYIYVRDVVYAYLCLAEGMSGESVRGGAFNFSTEAPVTALELVRKIQRLMGCEKIEPEVRNVARAEIHSQYLSAAKARETLGWRPHFSLEEGLTQTIDWYMRFLGATDGRQLAQCIS